MQLPGGTVSFLMTDVEASTRLWERDAQATGQAIARHEQLLAGAIGSFGGTVIKSRGEGDSVFAVFERAGDAAAAALAGQRALLAERWATPVAIRVRMAIHSGQAQPREGDYYGPAVNRCARLRGIAHGAQVVLSRASAELAREELPEGAWLESRGRHRLRDLSEAEEVFELRHADLPADHPPLKSVDAPRHSGPGRDCGSSLRCC